MNHKYFQINEAGNSIHCKIYYHDLHAVNRVVICLHGFSGHMDNKAVERFSDYVLKKHRDVAVLIYNAPCHGNDVKKKLLLNDCMTYLSMVTAYAAKRFQTDELYIYANSFGGYQVLKYISDNGMPYRKIALRCPAVNMYEVISDTIMAADEKKALEKNKPVLVGFDRKIKITRRFTEDLREADITARDFRAFADDILIIHGTKDEIVPFDVVKTFANRNGITFVPVENADHRFVDPMKMDAAIKAITEFIAF